MLNIGYILDKKYEVVKILGSGGMGTVYLCKNIRLGSFWAIKEIKKNDKAKADILSEPNILKKLSHPGIPRLVDIFYSENNLYMVEDYIEGQTLKEYIKEEGIISPEESCRIISSICDILSYLHGMNPPVIYRDLKPSNIMITPNQNVILIDFGISKIYKTHKNSDTVPMGSNGFAAPEQHGLGQSCRQTDIYGLGMVMYFMITGKVSSTGVEPLIDENYGDNINNDLKKIIQKCVRVDIKDRFVSVQELNRKIKEYLNKTGFEKTMLLNKSSQNSAIKSKKRKIRRNALLLLAAAVVVLSVLYFQNSNLKKYNDVDTISIPKAEDNIKSVPIEEKQQPDEKNDAGNIKNEGNTDNNQTYGKQHKGNGNSKKKKVNQK